MKNKIDNQDQKIDENKLGNNLEDFTLWKESRKLMNVLTRAIKDEGEFSKYFRNTIPSMAESIFIHSAEIFEFMKNNKTSVAMNIIDGGIKDLAALRTLIYIYFDRGRLEVDYFSEIILQLSKVRKEFECLRKIQNDILNLSIDNPDEIDLKKIFH